MKINYFLIILVSSLLLTTNTSTAVETEGAYGSGADATSSTTSDTINAGYEVLGELQNIVNSDTSNTRSNDDNSAVFAAGYDVLNALNNIVYNSANNNNNSGTTNISDFGYTDFSDPELAKHEVAIKTAIREANRQCGRNCSAKERAEIINQYYFNDLNRLDSALPQGPLESMAYFINNIENYDPDNLDSMQDIDEAVRSGEIRAIMPSQFPFVYPREYASYESIQQLGVTNAVTLTVPERVRGLALPFGGYGGTIVVGRTVSSYSFDTLKHESSHAGEQVIVSIINDNSVGSTHQGNFDNLTHEDYLSVISAYQIISSNLLGNSTDTLECADCDSLTSLPLKTREYLINPLELRAFASEGEAGIRGYSEFLSRGANLSSQNAEKVAREILTSSMLVEQMNFIDQAAEILLESGF